MEKAMTQVGDTTAPKALSGIRVVDFTWVRAGPWATRWLGALGAEVIKVEWPLREFGRAGGPANTPPGIQPSLNTSGHFNDTNANKLSLSLNVRSPRGIEIIKKLISESDVVVENYSADVLESWGLGYEELKKLSPNIVYVSMSGFGHTGRDKHYTTFGPSAQALSGMTFASGLPNQPPAGWGWSYLDDTGGMYIAFYTMAAIFHRKMTGQGQHVDMGQMVMGATLNGPALLDMTINGRKSQREGYPSGNRAHWPGTPQLSNYRGQTVAPHNSYRTKGGDYNDWCTIACFSDQEWLNLVGLMGSPAWASNGKFATVQGRLQHQEELDQGIETWSLTLEKYELMKRCQASGVRAMPVQSNEDRAEHDPQLRERGMYQEVEHPVLGSWRLQNAPFKLSETPAVNHRHGPLIGQDNREILMGLLGMSQEELSSGYEDGTFWPKEMERYPYQEELIR
jgi:crotonobetainyl-CoA:carnitine CoA-transferase CaiB-like acyl-CoA transferase